MNEKTIKPPYTSYRSFQTLMKELRDHEVVPAVIDRSLLSKRSGSEQSALIATFKWFGLIDDSGAPTQLLQNFIVANESQANVLLKSMMERSYPAVTDGTFNLRSATSAQMTDRFRLYDISGSTLSKSISFFLAAAKDAGIAVSPHVKAPAAPSGSAKKKPKSPINPAAEGHATLGKTPRPPRDGMVAIPIPIYGGSDGVIYLPGSMTPKQWANVIKMTEFILQNYRDTMAEQAIGGAQEDE